MVMMTMLITTKWGDGGSSDDYDVVIDRHSTEFDDDLQLKRFHVQFHQF